MAKSRIRARAEKDEEVDTLAEKLTEAEIAVLTEYRGLSVSDLQDLRGRLRPLGVEYIVAKNTMARFAAEPPAAVKMARMRLKPATRREEETDATRQADSRAVELLEALGTSEARAFLMELAGGEPTAWRTREARRAAERSK